MIGHIGKISNKKSALLPESRPHGGVPRGFLTLWRLPFLIPIKQPFGVLSIFSGLPGRHTPQYACPRGVRFSSVPGLPHRIMNPPSTEIDWPVT
jgi:hypothetical protein